MNMYDFVEVTDLYPGDCIYFNQKVMRIFAIKIDIHDRVELTLLLPEEITNGQVHAVIVKFNCDEGVMRVNEYCDFEEEEEEEDGR